MSLPSCKEVTAYVWRKSSASARVSAAPKILETAKSCVIASTAYDRIEALEKAEEKRINRERTDKFLMIYHLGNEGK